jgi:hypothetical protein
MRIWTLHPRYLDTKGLLALWRESLLAQKVLQGETRGYRNHPQLKRFKSLANPVGAIAKYLHFVSLEADARGYKFNAAKIALPYDNAEILCTRGQLLYEWHHLQEKLKARDAARFQATQDIAEPAPHPMFRIIEGEIEDWEIIQPAP